jgi:glycosyltransferase involved in cell wall biosynthesis
MNVLILDRSLGNSYSLGLAGGLRAHGVDAAVAGPANWPSDRVMPFYRRGTPAGEARAAKIGESVVGVWRAARYGLSARPEILHLQWPAANDIVLARAVATTSRVLTVFTLHNPTPRHPTEHDRFQEVALRMAHRIIVHGPLMRDQLLDSHPELARKVHCVELGNYEHVITRFAPKTARAKLGLPDDRPLYSFLGNIRRRKGIEIFIRALAICRREGVDAHGVIAGTFDDSAYLGELRALDSSLSIGASLRWEIDRARLSQERLDLVASASDQVVLPFLSASQSASVIYAMTHGRCVVTTAVGELPRTVEGRGLLVPPESPELLAAAMRVVVDSPGLCAQYGERARRYAVDELSWVRVAADTRDVYQCAIQSA